MSAAIARRDEGCASDLLMDRWLLGELPGSDEGRRLEAHVRTCSGCGARFQALRSLYGSGQLPKAGAPMPPLSAPPKVPVPEQAAVLQVVILRDGLLVGTEVFTAGRYTVGSSAGCSLRLDELSAVHAGLSLRGDRVALEASGGPIFVNGFRTGACELRPIDEVAIGPYVLRARVLAERWQPQSVTLLSPLAPRAEKNRSEGEVVVEAGARRASAPSRVERSLRLELFWGDTRVEVKVLDALPASLAAFGIESAERTQDGFLLDGLVVAPGEPLRFEAGQLICVATVVPRAAPVPPRSPREWPWAVTGLAAMLCLAVLALGVYGANREEPDFTPKPIAPAVVHIFQKPLPPPVLKKPEAATEVAVKPTSSKPARATKPAVSKPIAAVAQLTQHDAIKNLLASMNRMPAGGAKKRPGAGSPIAGLGLPGAVNPDLTHFDSGGVGIGAAGARKGGQMPARNIGRGPVQGSVGSVSSRAVRLSDSSSIDRDALAKVITSHLHEISSCYERAMIASGSFAGKMTVEWAITTNGTVSNARVKTTDLRNAQFGSCVLGALKQWVFPKARGGTVVVSYPFVLNSVGY